MRLHCCAIQSDSFLWSHWRYHSLFTQLCQLLNLKQGEYFRSSLFWDVTQRELVVSCRHFGPIFKGQAITEERKSPLHRGGYLKSREFISCTTDKSLIQTEIFVALVTGVLVVSPCCSEECLVYDKLPENGKYSENSFSFSHLFMSLKWLIS
jgi:hypothetical protein